MKVALKDILPNPWRYLNKGYPINEEKIHKLRRSIKETGFWDNIVARKAGDNGKVELAYGHHRVEAMRREFPPDHEINVIVKDLDDSTMLKIMAKENDTIGALSPAIINETMRATIEFLTQHPEIKNELWTKKQLEKRRRIGAETKFPWPDNLSMAKYLDWPVSKVHEARAALDAFSEGYITRQEYESIPSQTLAHAFRLAVKRYPIPPEARARVIEKLKGERVGSERVLKEVMDEKYPHGKGLRSLDINDLARQVAKQLSDCNVLMTTEFIENIDAIDAASLQLLSLNVNAFIVKLNAIKERFGRKRMRKLEVLK